jgi:hypothetical protein
MNFSEHKQVFGRGFTINELLAHMSGAKPRKRGDFE